MTPSPETRAEALLAEASFVQRLARALVRDAATAEDISQDAMTAALQLPAEPRSWRHWLATVTRRLATKRRIADRRRSHHEANAGEPPTGDPEQTQRRLELQRTLTDVVLTLPEPYRTVVTLRFFDGLPPRAIAQRTGAGSDVVRQRLHRGLLMLREKLDHSYGSRQAWLATFGSFGLGGAVSPLIPLTLLAMKKLTIAAVTIVAGGILWTVAWPAGTAALSLPTTEQRMQPTPHTDVPPGVPVETPVREAVATIAPRCTVTVRDVAGRSVPEATVFCWDSDGAFVEGTTDEHGTVRFAAVGAGGLLARAHGHGPASRTLGERRGDHVLVLTECAVATGMLLIDGQPAPQGTELRPYGEAAHALTDVPVELHDQTTWKPEEKITTGPNGTFCLSGLPPGWQGGARLPYHLWLLPESGGTPQSHEGFKLDLGGDRVVHTTMLPSLHGQVVWDDSGRPIAGADVMVYGVFVGGENTPSSGVAVDRDGRFVAGLRTGRANDYLLWCDPKKRLPVESVQVTAQAHGSDGRTTITFTGEQMLAGPVTVRVPRAPTTSFVAVDAAGQPIAGVRVYTSSISEPSDERGRGAFFGRPSDVKQVGAKGYRIGPIEARRGSGTSDDPLVFELQTSNTIVIELLDADGRLPTAKCVIARGPELLFAGHRLLSHLDKAIHGTALGGQVSSSRQHSVTLELPQTGTTLTLHSLEPGIEATIAIVDAFGDDIVAQTFTTPQAGETRTITLRVATEPYAIAGRVVEESGAGIARAEVRLTEQDANGETLVAPSGRIAAAYAYSDREGRFRVYPVYGPKRVHMVIRANGYITTSRALGNGMHSEPIEVRLERGRSVTARVLDEHGEPLPLWPTVKAPHQQQKLGDGVTRFDDLPAGEVTFLLRIGSVEFAVGHDTSKPEVELRVPRPGMLRLLATNAWPHSEKDKNLVAIATRVDAQQRQHRIWRPDRGEEPHVLVPGRYRIELVEQHGYGEEATDVPLGPSCEATVRAGELATATLH